MAKLFKVMSTNFNFRQEARIASEVIAQLPLNQVVEIVTPDPGTGWSHVRTDVFRIATEGFVATQFLAPLNQPPATTVASLDVSTAQLKLLAPNAKNSIIEPLGDNADTILADFSINQNARRITHFLAQVAHECAGFRVLQENLNYSAEGLRRVFPSRFKTTEIAQQFARKPEQIANKIYADRIGNGSENSGDGWRYRGRGLIQLTGRANYEKYGPIAGVNIIADPDKAKEPETALMLAAAFWQSKGLNTLADKNQLKTITRRINGGLNGLQDRQSYLHHAQSIWGK